MQTAGGTQAALKQAKSDLAVKDAALQNLSDKTKRTEDDQQDSLRAKESTIRELQHALEEMKRQVSLLSALTGDL